MEKGPLMTRTSRILLAAACALAPAPSARSQTPPGQTQPSETAPAPATRQDTYRLRTGYAPGHWVFTQALESRSDITVDGAPRPGQEVDQTMVLDVRVAEAAEGPGRTVALSFRGIRQRVRVGKHEMTFDSEGPAEKNSERLAGILRPMLNARIVIRLDAEGKVAEVSGLDAMWEKITERNKSLAPLLTEMRKSLGDAMVRNLLVRANVLMPGKEVAVGDSWQAATELPIPMVGPVQAEYRCTLAKVDPSAAGEAVIGFEGRVQRDEPAPDVPVGSAKVKVMELEVSQSGQMRLALQPGMVTAQSLAQESSMTMSVTDQFGQLREVAVEQDAKIDLRVEPASGPPGGEAAGAR